MVDDIILPEESRKRLIQAFHMLAHKTEERPKKSTVTYRFNMEGLTNGE